MKRTERHHLKDNVLATRILHVRGVMEAHKREVTAAVIAIAVVGAIAIGYFVWRERTQTRAHALLAAAFIVRDARIAPPEAPGAPAAAAPTYPDERARAEAALGKFQAAADAYPSTDAGISARYQQAALLMALSRPVEAAVVYQDVIARGGDGIYAQTARLGLAEAQGRAGQFDQAIDGFKALAQRKDGTLPIDGILMQLGRMYRDAGKRADAEQTFNRLVEEYPDSLYAADARRELDSLKKM
jgi:TolA-binding protein